MKRGRGKWEGCAGKCTGPRRRSGFDAMHFVSVRHEDGWDITRIPRENFQVQQPQLMRC
jgi:hypothetical protein